MPADTRRERAIFGWPRDRGEVIHAVPDRYRDPDDHRAPELGPTAHSGDPQPWLRYANPLCGAGRHTNLMRVTPDHEFSPDGLAFMNGRVCEKCVPLWSARYAESIPGFDRFCRTCGEQKPVNEFRTDKRTGDGISNTCEGCRAAAGRGRRIAAATNERDRRLAQAETLREAELNRELTTLTAWQESAWTPTVRCASGHVLGATVLDGSLCWSCGCGAATVDLALKSLAWAADRAGLLNENDPTVVFVDL
jgi:hypothetical protein